MQNEQGKEVVVLVYMLSLLVMVIINLINDGTILDIVYLTCVVCCILKYLIIIKGK